MHVNVDEAGSDDLVRGVDDPARRRVDASRNGRNLIATNADVASEPGTAVPSTTRAFLITRSYGGSCARSTDEGSDERECQPACALRAESMRSTDKIAVK